MGRRKRSLENARGPADLARQALLCPFSVQPSPSQLNQVRDVKALLQAANLPAKLQHPAWVRRNQSNATHLPTLYRASPRAPDPFQQCPYRWTQVCNLAEAPGGSACALSCPLQSSMTSCMLHPLGIPSLAHAPDNGSPDPWKGLANPFTQRLSARVVQCSYGGSNAAIVGEVVLNGFLLLLLRELGLAICIACRQSKRC